ncbi:MAG: exodeoxyribonuclease V subunit beta [Gammaproteobacteria bacterium]|nr:exodeoxyribonuclease V subunit beta [Gammaproteobacteria bacterium]
MRPLDPLTLPCHGVRLIEASAGTGKTYTVATLYLRLLLEQQRSVRDILVVTFTVAATEELRDRIRARMREAIAVLQGEATEDAVLAALTDAQADRAAAARRLSDELTCIDEAAIFTIHGFCQRMLQEHAFESGTPFELELMADDRDLRHEVVQDFWRRTFYPGNAGLARLAYETWGTPAALYNAIKTHLARPDLRIVPDVPADACNGAAWHALHAAVASAWAAHGDTIAAELRDSKALSRDKSKGYPAYRLDAALAALDAHFANDSDDYVLPPDFQLFTRAHIEGAVLASSRKKGLEPPNHDFFDQCEALLRLRAARTMQLTAGALHFCREELARRKAERGVVSFDDLLTRLAEALHGAAGDALAEHIARRFPAAMIDEFQDTDPQQARIFSRIYRGRDDCALFMIGDPKQAIYSFRGADVFTYIDAKRATDAARDRFTLDTNWRSCAPLVEAVNALFKPHSAPFIFAEDIDFHPVQAAGKADAQPLRIDGEPPAPLRAWFVRAERAKLHHGRIPGAWSAHLSRACAVEISRLLALGAEGRAFVGDEPLAPHHIAVLVRTHREAQQVQAALREAGIPAVCQVRDSVFASEEAGELLRLMLAVAEPADERRLRAALATTFAGFTAADIDALVRDELRWENTLEQVQAFHDHWLARGFMPMLRRLLQAWDVAPRLLSLPDGERRMTNLLQLGELIQGAAREHPGMENLLRWYADQCSEPNGESEHQQLRLESDEALVKIVTVHKSKGLEYPLVFLPFLWSTRKVNGKGAVLCHDDARRPVLDLGSPERDEHYRRAERERLAEDLRLLYVALTRAKHLCYFTWGRFAGAERSALAWLLHGDGMAPDTDAFAAHMKALADDDLRRALTAWAARAPGGMTVEDLPFEQPAAAYRSPLAGLSFAARTPARHVNVDWRVTSYTGLAAGHDHERPDYGSRAEDVDEQAMPAGSHILQFPRGSRAGTFMHKLLERCDFPDARGAALAQEVQKQLQRHGFDASWQGAMEAMVGNVLDTPLDGAGLRLREVSAERRLIELEFYYPLRPFDAAELTRMTARFADYFHSGPALDFHVGAGVMRGFIDLVFEHDGRFYIADYKSNYLGARTADYERARVAAAVAANRYDLQYLIYCVALHRYLKRRVAGYDYERHFGGVYYLFLRGMDVRRGAETGVHFDRPEAALVEALDGLFAGRAA